MPHQHPTTEFFAVSGNALATCLIIAGCCLICDSRLLCTGWFDYALKAIYVSI